MLEIDITPYLGKTENVTVPGFVIQRIDMSGITTSKAAFHSWPMQRSKT